MPRLPLARAYRPQRFSEVLGQQAAVRALATAAQRGDLASAYIFSGTRGIGKTTLARIFAKSLNCEKGPAEDCCGVCTSCVEIAEGRSLDVLELDAATHTGIDDIRDLREAAQYPPNRDRHRVFILDEAHQLSTAAWNGLLKILEEPPTWCVFLFCTTEPHKIPPTIESRALHFSFRSPAPAQIREHLARIARAESLAIDDRALDLLVRAADGSVRDGLSALDQARALGGETLDEATVRDALGLIENEAITDYIDALAREDAARALAIVGSLEEEGQDLRAFVADALGRVRDLAVAQTVDPEGRSEDGRRARAFRIEALVFAGRVLDETETRLRQGGPQRTLVDLATVRIARMSGLTDLGAVAAALSRGGAMTPPAPGGTTRGEGTTPRRDPGAPPASGPRQAMPSTAPPRLAPPAAEAVPAPREEAVRATPAPHDAAENIAPALLAEIQAIRPSLQAYVGRLASATLDAEGVLHLYPSPSSASMSWLSRLGTEQARDAFGEAVRALFGRELARVALESARTNGSEAEPAARPISRQAILDQARRDPLVRKLFDRFGAVLVDGQPLAAVPDEPAERPRAPGDSP